VRPYHSPDQSEDGFADDPPALSEQSPVFRAGRLTRRCRVHSPRSACSDIGAGSHWASRPSMRKDGFTAEDIDHEQRRQDSLGRLRCQSVARGDGSHIPHMRVDRGGLIV
jgi:hypothetical protein